MTTTHLLYLHGFRSSPDSTKARKMAQQVAQRHPEVVWWCPPLPASPRQAMDMLVQGVAHWPRASMAVVGSSLGGFYARWIALHTGAARAVLLNPSAYPARDLQHQVGEHTLWGAPQARFVFEPEYLDELQLMQTQIAQWAVQRPTRAEGLLAIIAQGDELLDWREMQAFCAGGTVHLLSGSDHALSDFDEHMGAVLDFLHLTAPG